MSWYKGTDLTDTELRYLQTIQKIFRVQDATRVWIDLKLTPHQIEWHRSDVAIQGADAKSRIVYKSRNTSFTTSSLISNLMAVGHYSDQVVPFVRLNQERANDLINDCKKMIRKMKSVVRLQDGRFYPFDPDQVDMKAKGSIFFKDRGVEFRAFPATASASEIIRGLRIAGSAGIIDEGNFMRDYENIYIALRDAAAGFNDKGEKHFQMNIGTTLKGNSTPFKLWLDKQLDTKIKSNMIFKWPVFDPEHFNPDIPLTEQTLTTIVPWHQVEDLEEKRRENTNRFMEEYMCASVDSDDALYPQELILRTIDSSLSARHTPETKGMFFMGVDVGFTNDFFSISIFEKIDDRYIHRYIYYRQGVDPEDMEEHCRNIIKLWNPVKARIDANGVGFQLGETLKKEFGAVVEAVRTSKIKGLEQGESVKFSEYIHTNQLWLMNSKRLVFLNDEMLIIHYGMWDQQYKAPRTSEHGHGDITISNGLALLPITWKTFKGFTGIKTTIDNDKEKYKSTKDALEEFSRISIKNRMKFYKGYWRS